MTNNKRIPLYNSISVRIPSIIVIILLIGIGSTIGYYLTTQNNTIIETKEKEITHEAEIIFVSLKNNMLAGEAPIVVNLFRDFTRKKLVSEIKIFRSDGIIAFSDNSTIEKVNTIIGKPKFEVHGTIFPYEKRNDPDFKKSVSNVNDVYAKDLQGNEKIIVIFKPLINQPRCTQCHGVDHLVRGVLSISSPITAAYVKMKYNILTSFIIYGLVVSLLTIIIILFLRYVIILRIMSIGNVVERVGEGDFKMKTGILFHDEIGELAKRINVMIDGLNERFKLTKFVSRSTLEHVRKDGELRLGGEKKELTVMFSDIRGFTSYSENRDPEIVMSKLNSIMNMQAGIVQEFNGDINKFVGDEIMAIFDGEDMVLRALKAAEKIRNEINRFNETEEVPFYVGIGINTGEMIAGNMGSIDRIDRTVIGDAVNLGARLCSIAGKNTIIMSEYSFRHVSEKVEVNDHEPIKVKGKENMIKIYTLRKTL